MITELIQRSGGTVVDIENIAKYPKVVIGGREIIIGRTNSQGITPQLFAIANPIKFRRPKYVMALAIGTKTSNK